MLLKKALALFAVLIALSALVWIAPTPAKARPGDQALVSIRPQARHTALVKGPGGDLSFSVLAVSHAIVSPRDSASGLPSGKRQHKPFTITKVIDKASPSLMEALIKGEPVQVELTTHVRAGGRFEPFMTVRLENAFVASINPQGADDRPTEEVAFYYNRIAFQYLMTGTTVEDSWSGEYP
jgi:type VI secretion system secreted protein Hcp